MLQIYDFGMRLGNRILSAVSGKMSGKTSSKFFRFVEGQQKSLDEVAEAASSLDRSKPTVWFHAASLGEFGIARPIIKELKKNKDCNIVVTFFSPTGYEALTLRHMDEVDAVLFLPFDTAANASRFLDQISPDCAVFMVSEYWHNFLNELHARDIPALLVSAVINEKSPFFKWYGNLYRKSLGCFREIFVLNRKSGNLLNSLGINNVTVNGDPLFDNVILIASTHWEDPIIANFSKGHKIFIAGSIHNDQDLKMIAALANKHSDTRFIIVPHEIKTSTLSRISDAIHGKVKFYSQCTPDTSFDNTQVLIIDFVGALAYIYRYADWAYVGGGFTKLLHSVIEPAVYGLPVAFGPNVSRKVVTKEMIDLGIGKITSDFQELDRWFCSLKNNDSKLREISRKAALFVSNNAGATRRVVNRIIEELCSKK